MSNSFIDLVREFHKAFGCTISTVPRFPHPSEMDLREALVREEFEEFIEALHRRDFANFADAIADLHYVLSGTSLAFGIPENEVFAEVHRSNMTKLWPDGAAHKSPGGKILKPPGFSAPEIWSTITKAYASK